MTNTKRFTDTALFQFVLATQTLFLFVILALSLVGNAHAVEQDKLLHVGAGCAVSVVTNSLLGNDYSPTEKVVLSIFAGTVAGVTKEYYDLHHVGHTSDVRDAVATSLGSALCVKVAFSF